MASVQTERNREEGGRGFKQLLPCQQRRRLSAVSSSWAGIRGKVSMCLQRSDLQHSLSPMRVASLNGNLGNKRRGGELSRRELTTWKLGRQGHIGTHPRMVHLGRFSEPRISRLPSPLDLTQRKPHLLAEASLSGHLTL